MAKKLKLENTVGESLTAGQESYFATSSKPTSIAPRLNSSLFSLKYEDKNILDVAGTLIADCPTGKDPVAKARINATTPILKKGKDVTFKASIQSRTTLNNLSNLDEVQKGGLTESLRVPLNLSGNIKNTNLSGYAIPNVSWTTGSDKTSLGYTAGLQIKNNPTGLAVYGEYYKKFGTIDKLTKNTPGTYGFGIVAPLKLQ